MTQIQILVGIASILAIGAMSPGPSFLLVARTAVSLSRAHGLFTALGMGAGGLLFAVAALLGLQGLFLAIPSLYMILKIVGGLYLAYMGVRILRGAKQSIDAERAEVQASVSLRRAFVVGLMTQISNPKTAIVYASVFAAFLPAHVSLGFSLVIAIMTFLIEATWYGLVATALSAEKARRTFTRYKSAIDRVAGAAMIVLGVKLASTAKT